MRLLPLFLATLLGSPLLLSAADDPLAPFAALTGHWKSSAVHHEQTGADWRETSAIEIRWLLGRTYLVIACQRTDEAGRTREVQHYLTYSSATGEYEMLTLRAGTAQRTLLRGRYDSTRSELRLAGEIVTAQGPANIRGTWRFESADRFVLTNEAFEAGNWRRDYQETFIRVAPPSPHEVVAEYAAAWVADDPERILALFSADAVVVPQGRGPLRGHDQLRGFWWPPGAITRVTRFDSTVEETQVEGTLGFARGAFDFAFTYEDARGTQSLTNRGHYVMLFRLEQGRWLITHRFWSDLPRRP